MGNSPKPAVLLTGKKVKKLVVFAVTAIRKVVFITNNITECLRINDCGQDTDLTIFSNQ